MKKIRMILAALIAAGLFTITACNTGAGNNTANNDENGSAQNSSSQTENIPLQSDGASKNINDYIKKGKSTLVTFDYDAYFGDNEAYQFYVDNEPSYTKKDEHTSDRTLTLDDVSRICAESSDFTTIYRKIQEIQYIPLQINHRLSGMTEDRNFAGDYYLVYDVGDNVLVYVFYGLVIAESRDKPYRYIELYADEEAAAVERTIDETVASVYRASGISAPSDVVKREKVNTIDELLNGKKPD